MKNPIKKIEKPFSKKELLSTMHPLLKEWFFSRFKDFSLPQLYGVLPIWKRQNILITAPTGGTKTLTAFLSILNYLIILAEKNELEDKIYAIYVSPLRALNNDIYVNLQKPLVEIKEIAKKKGIKLQEIRVGLRTSDTSSEEKAKQLKKPPHILVTTPESLAIVLSSKRFIEHLKAVEFCIIDEIHALASNKRGVHLSLSLERLNEISKIEPVRIGLSATIAPLEEIAKFLTGYDYDEKTNQYVLRHCLIADVRFAKSTDISVLTPSKFFEQAELQSKKLYSLIDELIQKHRTTLIFTNTRSGTERVIEHLKQMFPKRYEALDAIGAHHSSLSRRLRFNIEQRLREGKLKAVVSSTSLELGIDIGYIDLVILLGSPKSVARAMQRCLPYNSKILCSDGTYKKIGEIVEKKLNQEIISFNGKDYVKNKIIKWHKYTDNELIKIKLGCGEEIELTKEHPLLTLNGWKLAKDLTKKDKIAEFKGIEINKINYFFEFLPKNKVFVVNKNNFFQKSIDKYLEKNKINLKKFSEKFGIPYSRLIDCRRLKGRKKSIRLDYFLKVCKVCKIPFKVYSRYLRYLKTKGNRWPRWPLKINKELMWLAGIVASDGCIVKNNKEGEYFKIKIGNKDKKIIDKVKKIVKKFEIKPYLVKKNGIWHIEFGSNILAYFFISLGIPYKNKSFKIKLNEKFFGLSNELIHTFLEGVVEGDGNISIEPKKYRYLIRIFTASKEFAYDLHRLFLKLGYSNRISKKKIKKSKLIKKVSKGNLYTIFISRKKDVVWFLKRCYGFGNKISKNREIIKNIKINKTKEKINWIEIKEIKKIKKKIKVYNLTLKEPNNFIVNCIIVHNCGRAGHKLHATAKGRFIVLDRDDLIECSIMAKKIREREIDRVQIPKNCLDVLTQHVYGEAINRVWHLDDFYRLVRQSYCFHDLSKEDLLNVIAYLSGQYFGLEQRGIYAKIWWDEKTKEFGRRSKLARMMYMTNLGTIPEESYVNVIVARPIERRNEKVGVIDEAFLERLKPGDVFVLGGQKYQFLYAKGMNAYVNASVKQPPTIPSWFSEMLPLSFDLALAIQQFRLLLEQKLKQVEKGKLSKDKAIEWIQNYCYCNKQVAQAIYEYFYEQYSYAEIPHAKKLLIEFYKASDGKKYWIFHSLYGRRVNDALSRALAFLTAKLSRRDVEIGINDNGFYLASYDKIQVEQAFNALLKNWQKLKLILDEAIEKTEAFKRRFRHNAVRTLLILRSYKGKTKSIAKQQLQADMLYKSIKAISENFPAIKETRREVLEDVMDIANASKVLEWIVKGKVEVKKIQTDLPSPFAFNLIAQGYLDLLKIEDRIEFLRRMHEKILERIGEKNYF